MGCSGRLVEIGHCDRFGTAGLSPAGTGQKLLFSDPEEEKQKKIDQVYDKIRGKFGDESLKRGL